MAKRPQSAGSADGRDGSEDLQDEPERPEQDAERADGWCDDVRQQAAGGRDVEADPDCGPCLFGRVPGLDDSCLVVLGLDDLGAESHASEDTMFADTAPETIR